MIGNISILIPCVAALTMGVTLHSSRISADLLDSASGNTVAEVSGGAAPDDAFDCLIEPMSLIELGGSTPGIVERILVKRGERVKKHQPIIVLESSVENAFIEQAEVRAGMKSEIQAREAEFALAKLEFARFEEMHERELAPKQQRDEAAARLRVAAAAVVQADDNRRLMQLDLQRMRYEVARRTLRSPVDGVVVEHLVSVGEAVRDDPVTRIVQLDPLRVEVVLPGRLFGSISRGYGARIYPEFIDGPPMITNVDVVDPMLDAQSGTFGVGLTLANANMSIAGGQRCRIAFNDAPPVAAANGTQKSAGDAETGNRAAGALTDATASEPPAE